MTYISVHSIGYTYKILSSTSYVDHISCVRTLSDLHQVKFLFQIKIFRISQEGERYVKNMIQSQIFLIT